MELGTASGSLCVTILRPPLSRKRVMAYERPSALRSGCNRYGARRGARKLAPQESPFCIYSMNLDEGGGFSDG